MPQPSLILWGASGHASVVADVVRCEGKYRLIGCIDDYNAEARKTSAGDVLGSSDELPRLLREGVTHVLIAIGDNATRLRLAEKAVNLGLDLATAIHPRATVAENAAIGRGTVVMAGAVVSPGAVIGANSIINTCASVDHDCQLGDGVHVCPGAHLAGRVTVDEGTMIGVGACVRDGMRIGAHCVIGAGAAVVKDIPDYCLAVGVPARVVKWLAKVV